MLRAAFSKIWKMSKKVIPGRLSGVAGHGEGSYRSHRCSRGLSAGLA